MSGRSIVSIAGEVGYSPYANYGKKLEQLEEEAVPTYRPTVIFHPKGEKIERTLRPVTTPQKRVDLSGFVMDDDEE